jgi:hypothetical protein
MECNLVQLHSNLLQHMWIKMNTYASKQGLGGVGWSGLNWSRGWFASIVTFPGWAFIDLRCCVRQ